VVVVMVVWVWRCDDGGEKGEEDREEQDWAAHLGGCAGCFAKTFVWCRGNKSEEKGLSGKRHVFIDQKDVGFD